MENRTLVYLTSFVILSMLILLGINMTSILTGEPKTQTYLQYNNVRGMAVVHNQLPYTLNFDQQNAIVDIINRSVRVVGVKPGKRQKPDIEQLIVYQFDDQPDLVIEPIAYVDQNLVFSVPQWETKGYFMELSDGGLYNLLSTTYDP
jgi:hypothetical protein